MEASRLGLCEAIGRLLILLDTNMLIYMAQGLVAPSSFHDAVDMAFALATCSQVVEELRLLARSAPKASTRRLARRAEWLIEKLRVSVVECPDAPEADDSLLLAARQCIASGGRAAIATGDRALRRRARQLGVPSIYYRESERRLEAEWLPP